MHDFLDIFAFENNHDLETRVRGHSRISENNIIRWIIYDSY